LPAKKTQLAAPTAPEPTTAEIRGLKPVDPDAEKKKLRDSLLAEINSLERDLDLASTENERIRLARLSKRAPSPPANKHELLHLLGRHALPPDTNPPKPDPATDWLASALNPIAFLPFNKPSTQPVPTSQPHEDDLPPIASHHPLPMTAAEALPYLQVFHPLSFTAHVSPLPQTSSSSSNDDGDSEGRPILQQHTITASSTSPRGLFSARIEMTVNTKTMTITKLSVPRLDLNAEGELRRFVEQVVVKKEAGDEKKGVGNSGMNNNVSVLAWGMGEWVRVAVQRARVWIVLEREVGSGEKGGLEGLVGRMRARRKKKRKRRRGGVEVGEGDDDDDGEEGSEDGVGKYGAADLLPFMGRTSMDFEIPVLEGAGEEVSALRVQWRIKFDWTGEARSEIGVLVGVPGKCELPLSLSLI
jgi:hypothetical protein